MPDIYGNIPINSTPEVESGVDLQRPNLDTTITGQTNPLTKTASTGNPLLDLMNSTRLTVSKQPWVRAQTYNRPTVITPFKYAERYTNSGILFNPLDANMEQEANDADQSGLWGTLKAIGNRLVKIGAGATVSILNSAKDIGDLFTPQSAVNDTFQTDTSKWLERLDQVYTPNYQSQYQKDNPLLSYFNPLHVQSFLDNLGKAGQALAPIAGTVATAALADIPLGVITDGIADRLLAPKQFSRIMENLGDLSKGLTASDEDFNTFKTLLQTGEDLSQKSNKALTAARGFKYGANTTRFIVANGLSAYTMSMMIGNDTYNQVKNDLQNNYRDEYGNFNGTDDISKKIETTATEAGKAVVIPNFAFMAVSSALGLGAILKPSQAAIDATEKALAKQASVSLNPVNPNVFDVIPKEYGKGITGFLQKGLSKRGLLFDNVRQALTMGGFYVASDATKNYYEHQFDLGGVKDSMTLADYYMQSLGKLFTTPEGRDQLAIGFLGGAFEHLGKYVTNRVRGIETDPTKIAENIAASLNRYTRTGLFDVSRNEAISVASIIKQMQDAAASGDVFKYKNLQHSALFNFVLSGERSHQFDARINQLESLKTLNKENFETLFGIDFTEANKKTVSEYVDSVIKKAKEIQSTIKKVDGAFLNNPFNPSSQKEDYAAYNFYKGELAYALSAQKDYLRRSNDIKNKTLDKIPGADFNDLKALAYKDGINQTMIKFVNRINDLKDSEKLAGDNESIKKPFTDERKFLEEKLTDLKGNLVNWDPDLYLASLKDIYKYYGNGNQIEGTTHLDDIDVLELLQDVHDFNKLDYYNREIADKYRKLTGKDGYENFRGELYTNLFGFADQISVDNKGLFHIKSNQSAPPDIVTPQSHITYLGVQDVEEAKKKIQAKDPEFIAKVIDPNYEQSDDPNTIGKKIVSGEVPITTELQKQATDNVEGDFQRIRPETPEERAARIDADAKAQGVYTPNAAAANAAMDAVYADQDAKLAAANPNPSVSNNVKDKIWKFLGPMNPIRLFNSLFHRDTQDVKESSNLYKHVFFTPVEELPEKVYGKLRAEISEDTSDGKEKFFRIPGSKGLYRKTPHPQVTRVYIGDDIVGIINPPSTTMFKRGDSYVPVTEFADKAEYAEATGNNPDTFDTFMKSAKEFEQAYNELVKGYNKEVLVVDNPKLLSIFTPVINYGIRDTSDNEGDSTLIKDLKYKGKGSAILSFRNQISSSTGLPERSRTPTILNEDELTDAEVYDVMTFVDKNIDAFMQHDMRYFYLAKLPEGKFDTASIIIARPANETEAGLAESYDIIRAAVSGEKDSKEASRALSDALYLSDRNVSKGNKGKVYGNQIRFHIDEDGNLNIRTFNTFHKIKGKTVKISKEDVLATNNFDQLSTLIQTRYEQAKREDYNLGQRLRPILEKTSFKKGSPNDEEISAEQAATTLKASVKPNVFQSYTIEFMPKNGTAADTIIIPAPVADTKGATPEELREGLGNMGKGLGAGIMEADIKSKGFSVTRNGTKMTPEQRQNFNNNFEVVKSKFPDKDLEIVEQGNDLVIREKKNQIVSNAKDTVINNSLDSIITQLEQKGIAKKNC